VKNMRTKVIKISSESDFDLLKEPAKCLKEGGLVVFPTETVYGLGANALNEDSVRKIFEAKGRPSDNPLIVHVASRDQAEDVTKSIPEAARKVMDKLWPGPITLVMPRAENVPDCVTAGLDTVAVRYPEHPVAKELLRLSGIPVAAPSANTSGRPSPTKAEHVLEDLDGKVDYIIDGGNCNVGLESTVLDTTTAPAQILRPGGIGLEELEEILGKVVYDPGLTQDGVAPKSPGMKYKHYAPKAAMIIIEGKEISKTINELLEKARRDSKKTGVLTCGEKDYRADFVRNLGADAASYAANLFDALREFDLLGAEVIFAELPFGEKGIEPAIRNRIYKAAGGNVIKC
jgi:L-threonylcarbamoyladenylate synthase